MEREQAQAKKLVLVDEVPQVGPGEARARGAVAAFVERPGVASVLRVAEIEAPLPRRRAAGAGGSRRQNAVEHVDTGLDHLEDALGVADAHEVARLAGRHQRGGLRGGLERGAALLADRQAADRVSVEVELGDLLGRAAAELRVDPALADPEAELALGARRVALPGGPVGRPADRILELAAGDVGGRDLVEAHRDVAAQVALDLRRELGREVRLGAVVDVAERDAVVVHRRQRVAEGEDLETAGVGENRAVPPHEPVQPAELGDQLVARAEMQVVGVAEHDLRAEPAHLVRIQRLHGRLRPDRHEHRRAHLAVRGREDPGPRSTVSCREAKRAHGCSIATFGHVRCQARETEVSRGCEKSVTIRPHVPFQRV